MRSAYEVAADILDPPEAADPEEMAALAGSLRSFIRGAWSVVEPQTTYLHNWHIDLIAEHLELVDLGEIRRLVINVPPRYMKSLTVSVFWPTWSWITRPHTRWLFSSYSGLLATKHSVDRRTILLSAWYQARFGDRFRLTSDQNVKTEFVNDARGHMVATGFKGSATGKGGDRVVIDDPHDPEQAISETQREGAIRRFDQTLSTRLDDKRKGAIVVVMQRLHEHDLTGHLLAQDENWVHVKVPATVPERTVVVMPRSDTEIVREPRTPLWPEREGPAELAAARVALGSYGYSGQYDQDPTPLEGGMLRRQWWRFWVPRGRADDFPPVKVKLEGGTYATCDTVEIPELSEHLQSWDMAFKDKADSDYVVGQVWARNGADAFLLDQERDHLDLPATLTRVRAVSSRWPQATAKLVEDKANGPAVISSLRHEIAGIIEVEPQGGKVARVAAVSPMIEAGNVYLPHPVMSPWVAALIEETSAFPNGTNDDQVDALSQALIRYRGASAASASSPGSAKLGKLRRPGRVTGT